MNKFDITYNNLDDYLLASISGKWTDYAAQDGTEEIKRKAESYGKARVLLDLMNMTPPDSENVEVAQGRSSVETRVYQ